MRERERELSLRHDYYVVDDYTATKSLLNRNTKCHYTTLYTQIIKKQGE